MKLKSIQIHGFKSFADRVTIKYDDGITGVIGPNGSGKSNVIDAVRWVMGEQTAKSLRADEPTDIIFAGSQTRKPLSLAEVTLTFANDGRNCPPEFRHLPEVSITRRIYRDGEREYLINKESCRLRDISQFLMSIGLGSRTYAIIQQERRDRIVQAKPDDMRAILEETAGITLFKQQRKEAQKRLHATSEQFEKLEAVETELQRQSEHLAEQVEKAKQKILLSQELRDTEIALLADNVAFYKSIALAIRAELAKSSESSQKSTVDTAGFEAEATRLTAEKLELFHQKRAQEDETEEKRLLLTQLRERLTNQGSLRADRLRQVESLRKQIEAEELERQEAQGKQERSGELLNSSSDETERLDRDIEAFAMQEEELEEELRTLQGRLEGIRAEQRVIASRSEDATARQKDLLSDLEAHAELAREMEERQKEKQDEWDMLELELADLQASENQEKQNLTEQEQALAEILKKQATCKQRKAELAGQHEVLHRKLLEIDAKLQSLRELLQGQDAPTGDDDRAQQAREAEIAQLLSSCHPFFSNFSLPEAEEDLLERCLPELVDARTTPDPAVLLKADACKSVHRSVRRHFLTPEIVSGLSSEEAQQAKALQDSGEARQASTLLQKGKDHPLKHFFERIFFCSSLQIALSLKRKYAENAHFFFLSPSGATILPHGEVRMGLSQDVRVQGVLKRRREMDQLNEARRKTYAQLSVFESELHDLELELSEIEQESEKKKGEISAKREAAIRREADLTTISLKIQHCRESQEKIQREQDVTQERMAHLQTRVQDILSVSQSDAQKSVTLQERAEELEQEQEEVKERWAEVRQLLAERRSDKQVLQERLSHARTQFEELNLQMTRSHEKLERIRNELRSLEAALSGGDEGEAQLREQIAELTESVAIGESRLDDMEGRLAEFEEQIHVLESRISAEKDVQIKHERFLAEKQSDLTKAETILETLYKDAWERFKLSENDFVQTERPEEDNRPALEKKISGFKKQLEGLGPINEAAMGEYEETSQKLEFLIAQKRDIAASSESLQRAIAEVEERTKESFLETFQKVGTEFEKLFPILFPGGEARLNLLEPEDLLNTGVEILVRLPGKRMQNMSLFSGGEKALTAISLIFAILKTSPAPFCYLDEVDAPLDEANVGRFNSVLEALSDEFQFVVITHNRRTMEVLDTIYGISMNEPGVSRLVSVDLSEVPQRLQKKTKEKKEEARRGERAGASAEA